jgi:hypothetical protein
MVNCDNIKVFPKVSPQGEGHKVKDLGTKNKHLTTNSTPVESQSPYIER